MVSPLPRPPDGATTAYVLARSLRLHREWLVTEVASGQMGLTDLNYEDDSDLRVGTVKVIALVGALPASDEARARLAMTELGIPIDARWGELDRSTAAALWRQLG